MSQQLALYEGTRRSAFLRPQGPAVKYGVNPISARMVTQGRRALRVGRGADQVTGARVQLCAGCREHEARYGFRVDEQTPSTERPRTLCFNCFRIELGRRQAVAERMARGWDATQTELPLSETLAQLDRRRRRAQIAARHALNLG